MIYTWSTRGMLTGLMHQWHDTAMQEKWYASDLLPDLRQLGLRDCSAEQVVGHAHRPTSVPDILWPETTKEQHTWNKTEWSRLRSRNLSNRAHSTFAVTPTAEHKELECQALPQ